MSRGLFTAAGDKLCRKCGAAYPATWRFWRVKLSPKGRVYFCSPCNKCRYATQDEWREKQRETQRG